MNVRMVARFAAVLVAVVLAFNGAPRSVRVEAARFDSGPAVESPVIPTPAIDERYTRIANQNLDDPRITTELVDHLPASDRVPTPLRFLGRVAGAPGELTYAADIARYYDALARSSPRAKLWTIGTSEEGRAMVLLAIADESTIASLDRHRDMLSALTDPRRTTDSRAAELIGTAKPIYWITAGIHSPETGGPETLIELAYRLIVEDTPFIRNIRENVITFITPVLEVDGREKAVDTYYFNKARAVGDTRLPLVYWGRYVAHDNNRDGIGQQLEVTRAVTETTLAWHPTIVHDLHESQSYLYVSTGTGPYNTELDPIIPAEWWTLAENDVLELTKRGIPGVWTYGYYDGWAPNYLFFIAHTHNALGRFYEVQSYGPDPYELRPPASALAREWYRPNPPLPLIKWGPRNTVNIQQSALLFALSHVATNRVHYLENYWLKNKRAVDRGRSGPVYAWVVPATQRRKGAAAEAINDLRRQGLEFSVSTAPFHSAAVDVATGDYIVRGDQPFRTLADMYFATQHYSAQNPPPFDDVGWTFQLLRGIDVLPVADAGILSSPMTAVTSDVKPAGGVEGSGSVLILEHTAENRLATLRFRNTGVTMRAAEQPFEVSGRKFSAGSILIAAADRARLDRQLAGLGLSAVAVGALPSVRTHDLDAPRIGYVHSWLRTQDEGWWRAAFDEYGIPYTYFADQRLREGSLRDRFDVIVFPHVGVTAKEQVAGIPVVGSAPLPYRRSPETPHLGAVDSSDDIRGGLGVDGLIELARFVRQGGTLIAEGSTAAMLATYGMAPGIIVEEPAQLFARGSVFRAKLSDSKGPITYGYEGSDLPVYFNQSPVLNTAPAAIRNEFAEEFRQAARRAGVPLDARSRPRVVVQFPDEEKDMLLSGGLANGEYLAHRALAVDERLGEGHIVLFAMRPFWRRETQGSYFLVFNTLLNWNDLDAGK